MYLSQLHGHTAWPSIHPPPVHLCIQQHILTFACASVSNNHNLRMAEKVAPLHYRVCIITVHFTHKYFGASKCEGCALYESVLAGCTVLSILSTTINSY